MKHLQTILENNPPSHFLIAFGIAIVILAILVGVRHFVSTHIRHMASRTASHWDDILVETVSSTKTFILLVLSILLGLFTLDMSSQLRFFLIHASMVVFLCQAGISLSRGISSWVSYRTATRQRSEEEPDSSNYAIIGFTLRLTAWVIVVLLILDNVGVNVTALVASLGIGGVAIALAVQNILGDLFASLSIALDKPFLTGDFIVIDNLAGTVKSIGLKTTRITSITGEELVVSNADLLKSRIHNYKKMEVRRIVFTLGVTLNTPPEKLKRIPDIIRNIFSYIPTVRLDRVHFSSIGQSSLDFEIVYFVNNADYNVYVEAQHTFNLAVVERFAEESIAFAFPTRTLYINQSS